MPITIDGEKVPISDLKGTDLYCVHQFLNKVKGKAALMVYVDDEGQIQGAGVWRTKKALKQLEDHLNIEFKK